VAHRGARHVPGSYRGQLRAAADQLTAVGLRRCGDDLRTLAGLLGPNPAATTIVAWVNAHLRLLATAEHLQAVPARTSGDQPNTRGKVSN
jgi:hypothetical protein